MTMPDNNNDTTTTTTTGGNTTMFDNVTTAHASVNALTLSSYGPVSDGALTPLYRFSRAVDIAWNYSPRVVQKREYGTVTLAAVIVDRVGDASVSIALWNEHTGEWSRNPLTVSLESMDSDGALYCVIAPEQPAPRPRLIPRTSADALALADTLAAFNRTAPEQLRRAARYLAGGELNERGHALAQSLNLCGEYESIVCPVFGWEPRRGMSSRPARLMQRFNDDVDAIERQHADNGVAALAAFLDRFAAGSTVNRALIEHADNHLEQHKRAAVNELLAEIVPDWEPVPTLQEREYRVAVEVTRTFTATQTVYVNVTCDDDDSVGDYIDTDMLADAIDDDAWDVDTYGGTGRYDIDDWSVEDVHSA